MLHIAHLLLIALYLALPPAAVVADVLRARRHKRSKPSGSLVLSIFAAMPVGVLAAVLYDRVSQSDPRAHESGLRLSQVLIAVYFAAGLLLLLRAFDALLRLPSIALQRRAARQPDKARMLGVFDLLSGLVRVVLLVGIGVPYVVAAVLTYRPKLAEHGDPSSKLGYRFDSTSFVTSDGQRIAAWWIPASTSSSTGAPRRAVESDRTVVICHGFTGDKARQLSLARSFVPRGYNVLAIDFRAHGESGGQVFSYGDVERRDVLAAVKWLKEQRSRQARHVFGVGVDTGGAALIAAAADPSDAGQSIEAVAVYGTFDSLPNFAHATVRDRFAQPIRWLVQRLALPLASVQVGADLARFSPAELSQHLWPRPILVIHGARDVLVDFDRGAALYDAASQPKQRIWISDEGHDASIRDPDVGRQVREFFDNAQPVPVI